MPIGNPPTNVGELILKVTKSTANIAAHRAAMANVKAVTNPPAPKPEAEGVKPQ